MRGRGLAIAERQLRGHRGLDVKDAAHGPPVQRPGQVEQPRAFGGQRRAPAGERGHPAAQPLVGGQLGRVHLGESAAEDEPARPFGQVLIAQRIEGGHPCAGRLEQLALLRVAKVKAGPPATATTGAGAAGLAAADSGAADSSASGRTRQRPAGGGQARQRPAGQARRGSQAGPGSAGAGAPGRAERRCRTTRRSGQRSGDRWPASAARSAAGIRPRCRDGVTIPPVRLIAP